SIYRDRRGQRVIASVNAPLPTLIGFSGVFVAIAIGVTLGGRADHRVPKYPVSRVQRHPITGAVTVVAFDAGTLSAAKRVISRRAPATWPGIHVYGRRAGRAGLVVKDWTDSCIRSLGRHRPPS